MKARESSSPSQSIPRARPPACPPGARVWAKRTCPSKPRRPSPSTSATPKAAAWPSAPSPSITSRKRAISRSGAEGAEVRLAKIERPSDLSAMRDVNPVLAGEVDRRFVAGVGVAEDAGAGIGGEDTLDPAGGFGGAVGDDDHAGVDAQADADAAAVVQTDPARAG